MDIQIMECLPGHAKAIAGICAHGWQQTVAGQLSSAYQEIAKKAWYTEERVRSDIEEGIYKFCAVADGTVAGAIGGTIGEDLLSQIWVFYMDEAYRYKGIGKKLLEAFSLDHAAAGATEQWVTVMNKNYRAIPFYISNGFERHDRIIKRTETNEHEIVWRYKRKIPC